MIYLYFVFASIFSSYTNSCETASTFLEQTVYFVNQSNYSKAKESIYKSKKYFTDCSLEKKASIYHELAIVHMYEGVKDSAIYYTEKVLDLSAKFKNDSLRIKSLTNLGILLNKNKQHQEALNRYKEVWEYYHQEKQESNENKFKKSLSSSNVALTYLELKKADSAKWYIENSLRWLDREKLGFLEYNYFLASKIYQANRDINKAISYADSSLQAANKNNNTKHKILSLSKLIELKDDKQIDTYIDRLRLLENQESETWVKEILYKTLMSYYEGKGQYDLANDVLKRNVTYRDSINNESYTTKLKDLNTKYNEISLENEILKLNLEIEAQSKNNLTLGILSLSLTFILIIALIFYLNKRKYFNLIKTHQRDIDRFYTYLSNQSNQIEKSNEDKIYQDLINILKDEKIYLDSNLNTAKISKLIGTNTNYLSIAVNKIYGNNTSQLINQFRVEEAKKIIRDNFEKGEAKNLNELWEVCGFNSNVHFYRTFKKITKQTPLEYLKCLKIDLN